MDAERRKKVSEVGHWKKYQEWVKNTAVKYELLLDPEKDKDIIDYIANAPRKNGAIVKALRFYIKAHNK